LAARASGSSSATSDRSPTSCDWPAAGRRTLACGVIRSQSRTKIPRSGRQTLRCLDQERDNCMNLRHTVLSFGTVRRVLLTAASVLCGPLSRRSAPTACIDRLLCRSEECWRRPFRSAKARPCLPPSGYGTAGAQRRQDGRVETDGPTMRAVHRIEGRRRFRRCALVLCQMDAGQMTDPPTTAWVGAPLIGQ
jgi:hypothetical protein